jgi:hypothetical protein
MAETVPPPADPAHNSEGVQRFDSTFASFDNKVYVASSSYRIENLYVPASSATEFIAGTPNNPLAYGANDTTNSDFRIFSSDGNQTISRYGRKYDAHIPEILTGL